MNGPTRSSRVPVEVVFDGRRADPRTVDVCIDAARSLGPHSQRIDSCDVLVAERGDQTEIRIDIRAEEGEVIVDRIVTARDDRELRSELRRAFREAAHGIDETAHPHREHRGNGLRAGPPCIWYG